MGRIMRSGEWVEETWSAGLEWMRRCGLGEEGENTWHDVLGENEKREKGDCEGEWTGDRERGGHMEAGRRKID
jgi:hypothetical protein